MIPRRRARRASALPLVGLLLAAAPLGAQQPVTIEMRGRVLLNGEPASGAAVVVHAVGADDSGPLDTLHTGPDGGFRYRLPRVPDPENRQEVYFASVERGGVNYFGPLVSTAVELDSTYVIETYDNEPAPSAGAALPVTARYLLLEEVEGAGWMVTDLVHVRHEGERTLVAAPGGATFTYPVVEGASDLEVGGSQTTPDAVALVEGRLRVTSAIPPGEREFVVRYRVPDPFLTVRYPGATGEAELLVREPAPALEVEGLTAAPPVEMAEGQTYRRYAATGLRDATVSVREGEGEPLVPTRWLVVGLALLLASVALWSVLRPHESIAGQPGMVTPAAAGASPFERRQRLLLEVARLDEAREAGRIADPDQWAARRRALLERLRELG